MHDLTSAILRHNPTPEALDDLVMAYVHENAMIQSFCIFSNVNGGLFYHLSLYIPSDEGIAGEVYGILYDTSRAFVDNTKTFLVHLLSVTGSENTNKLPGLYVKVKIKDDKVIAIGSILGERWLWLDNTQGYTS